MIDRTVRYNIAKHIYLLAKKEQDKAESMTASVPSGDMSKMIDAAKQWGVNQGYMDIAEAMLTEEWWEGIDESIPPMGSKE